MTSLSIVELKIEPSSSSSCRISGALVRLPLCARTMWPPLKRTMAGCAFSMVLEPAVL